MDEQAAAKHKNDQAKLHVIKKKTILKEHTTAKNY